MESSHFDGAFKQKDPIRAPRRRRPTQEDEDADSSVRAAVAACVVDGLADELFRRLGGWWPVAHGGEGVSDGCEY